MRVGFSTTKGNFISQTIIKFTQSKAKVTPPISHTFPIFGDFDGVELGFSADDFMVNIVDVNRYREPGHVLRVYELPDRIPLSEWIPKVTHAYNQTNYGWFDLLWFVYRYLRRKHNPAWNGRNWFNMGLFCSEVTVLTLRAAGYSAELSGIDANATDAIELENMVASWPGAKLIESISV